MRTVAAAQFNIPESTIDDDLVFSSLPRPPDDLDIVELVLALEDVFHVEIPDEALVQAAGDPGHEHLVEGLTVRKLATIVEQARASRKR